METSDNTKYFVVVEDSPPSLYKGRVVYQKDDEIHPSAGEKRGGYKTFGFVDRYSNHGQRTHIGISAKERGKLLRVATREQVKKALRSNDYSEVNVFE
jgi:hypothetical protein